MLPNLIYCFDAPIAEGFGAGFTALLAFEAVSYAVGAVMWVLLMVSFLKRRSSVVLLFVVYIAAQLVVVAADAFLVQGLMPESLETLETRLVPTDYIRLFIFGAIWVPYFLRSERVKRTFVVRGPSHPPAPAWQAVHVEVPPPARSEDESHADDLERRARDQLRNGVPASEVVAWLTGQGLSPSMAAVVVNVLASRVDEADEGEGSTGTLHVATDVGEESRWVRPPTFPPIARIGLFGVVLLIVILGLIRC
jgi:hypothetical protein